MNKYSRNTISDRQFFSWYRSKCVIEDFLLQRTGSIFESLVQRTGGCTNFFKVTDHRGKALNSPNHYAITCAKIYKTVKISDSC